MADFLNWLISRIFGVFSSTRVSFFFALLLYARVLLEITLDSQMSPGAQFCKCLGNITLEMLYFSGELSKN